MGPKRSWFLVYAAKIVHEKKWNFSLTLVLVRAVDPQRRKYLSSKCLTNRKHLQKEEQCVLAQTRSCGHQL